MFPSLKAGLHISSRQLALAVVQKRRSVTQIQTVDVLELPVDTVCPSPGHLNVPDPVRFSDAVQKLLRPHRKLRHIALCLPDLAVRAAVVATQSDSLKNADMERFIRWQMEKLFPATLANSRIAFQPIVSSRGHFLATAIEHSILEQYEQAVRSARLEPVWVDIMAFRIFNLYQDVLQKKAGLSDHYLVLNFFDHHFTLLGIHQGELEFIRIKGLVKGPEPQNNPSSSEDDLLCDQVVTELKTSIGIYIKTRDPASLTHLFIHGNQVSGWVKKIHDRLDLEVELLEPGMLPHLQGLSEIPSDQTEVVIPAVSASMEMAREFPPLPRIRWS